MRTFLREITITLALAVAIFFVLQISVQSFVIVGSSMRPTFHDSQRILINKIVYNFHEPERGDVIVFHPPDNEQADYIKRIIALPGDTIEIKDGRVYVNGNKLDEPYIIALPSYTTKFREISEDKYFVLGDNRNNSNDSHTGWLVPRQNIIGKAWLSIWPPSEWGIAANYALPG
ncbi:Signal peptidase IB [subsurface metagenome]